MYEEEGEQLAGSYAIFFAEGENLAKKKEFKKAIESFTKALEFQADDRACFVARSKCYLQLGDTASALKDAESSLKEDDKFHGGLYRKAEALYRMGNFEHALVFYHRGNKIRPDLEEFILGIQKAQEAITNSIGTPESCKLDKTGDLSFFKQQDTVGKKKTTKAQKAASLHVKTKKGPVASERTLKELLGELYTDHEYLEKLSKDTEIGNKDSTIYSLIQDGISYLDTRAEFWRQQKPMYTRKREKELKKWKPPPTRPQNPSKATRANKELLVDHAGYVLKSIEDIDNALARGDTKRSVSQAEQAIMTVQSLSETELPNKMQFLATLHSCLGNAHLELGHTELAMEHFEKDMQIAEEEDYPEARGRALYNLGRVHSMMGDYEQGIEYWLKRIPMLKTSEESAWLFHEIGRGYWELSKYEQAKEYGIKSLNSAQDCHDQFWQLNAGMLIAQAEVKIGELTNAVTSFQDCLELAKVIDDTDSEEAIKKALEEVNSQIVESLQQQQQAEIPQEQPDS